jgi:nitrite reductase/ring-hydroxylating ferredoxin subunit
MQRLKALLIVSSVIFIISACRRQEHPVPYAPVNVVLYVSDPEFFPLNVIGGSIYHRGGSRGLIIHRRSQDEFIALERHCPYQPEDPCGRVYFDSTALFTLIDTCCGSRFLVSDGTVQQGPATISLRKYFTEYDGVKVTVTN